jgi:hypothetical protein
MRYVFTREDYLRKASVVGGRRRAAFWRKLGFPNLVLARAKQAELRALRKLEQEKQAKPEAKKANALLLSDREL